MENSKVNNEDSNEEIIKNNEMLSKIKEIDEKFKYFEDMKDNYDKLYIHKSIENIQLTKNNLDIIDKKINYFKLNKEYFNNKKSEIGLRLQLKKQTKNIIIEELFNNNENDDYFHLENEAFSYGNNNKNLLYKSEGLDDITKIIQ